MLDVRQDKLDDGWGPLATEPSVTLTKREFQTNSTFVSGSNYLNGHFFGKIEKYENYINPNLSCD